MTETNYTEIRNGSRILELTMEPRRPDTINILVNDTFEGVYRGIDVNIITLLNELAKIGALEPLLEAIRTGNPIKP